MLSSNDEMRDLQREVRSCSSTTDISWQVLPLNPRVQEHQKSVSMFTQLPPFSHRAARQKSKIHPDWSTNHLTEHRIHVNHRQTNQWIFDTGFLQTDLDTRRRSHPLCHYICRHLNKDYFRNRQRLQWKTGISTIRI